MELTRRETIDGMMAQYAAFADLVEPLTAADWDADTRCDGWQVRDVAGHVIGLCEDVAAGVPGSRDSAQEAASVRGDAPALAAARLRAALEQVQPLAAVLDDDAAWAGPSGVPDLTMGEGILTLWYDTFVHADDISVALGRPPQDGAGQRAAVAYLAGQLASRTWGPAQLVFTDADDGLGTVTIGATDRDTPCRYIATRDFVLAATGRVDATSVGLDQDVNIYAPA
jgi:uncharacterized protein (TIGR03083 family)